MRKRLLALSLIASMTAALFAGCGGKKEEEVAEENQVTYMYVGEYEKIADFGENSYLGNMILHGDDIYFVKNEYDPDTYENTSTFCKMPVAGGEVQELPLELMENAWVSAMCIGKEEAPVFVESVYDQETYEENYFLHVFDKDGNETYVKPLNEMIDSSGDYFYVQEIVCDENGHLYFSDGNENLYCVDQNTGELAFKIPSGYLNGMVGYENGIYALGYSKDNWEYEMKKIDFDKKGVDKTYSEVPSNCQNLVFGEDGKLYINSGSNLYVWNEETESTELVLNWLESDLDGSNLNSFSVLEDGRIAILLTEWGDEGSTTQKAILTKTEVSPENQKQLITLAVGYLDWNLKSEVLKFNRTNGTYKIRVVDYSDSNFEEIETKMLTDLSSKNAPDIVDFNYLNMKQLAAQNYLLDLYPYFNQDFQMSDFQENVVKSGEIDGKLYCITPSFSVNTSAAKTSLLNGQTQWDLKSLTEFVKNRPAGTEVFGYTSKADMLQMLLAYDADEFIDWKSGTCSFDSEEFKALLELCNEFPLEYEWDEDDESYPTKVRTNKMIIFNFSVSEPNEIQVYTKMAEEDITFIGMPIGGTCAPIITSSGIQLGITSKSKTPEGAWEFLKVLYSDDFQRQCYSFPVKKSVLEEKFKEASTPEYYTDENGEKVEQSQGSWGWDDWNVEIYAASEEDIAACRRLIDQACGNYSNDETLFEMISEETESYFKGQKSVDEVAAIIQSRMNIYVSENQ